MSRPVNPDPTLPQLATTTEDGATAATVRFVGATISQPVFLLARNLEVLYANAAAGALLEMPAEQCVGVLLGDSPLHVLAVALAARVPSLLSDASDTIFEVTIASRTWLCHTVALRESSGDAHCIAVFCHDVSHIHRHAQQQIAAQRDLTQALVREVRHRVKNHLQGVVGLLRQHEIRHPEAGRAFNQAITQLLAISTIYGLEARQPENQIFLCSMVDEIITMLAGTYRSAPIEPPEIDQRSTVSERHAVAIALVVNELLTNAIKHTPLTDGAVIRVALEFAPHLARLRIFNRPAQLPATMHSDSPTSGMGLNLVRSLLPIGHASLALHNDGEGVTTVLTLSPPVVQIR